MEMYGPFSVTHWLIFLLWWVGIINNVL